MFVTALLALGLFAADDASTISVTGTGSASRTAQRLAMTTNIDGKGKLAGDAITKQASFREQFDDAVNALGLEGLKIRSQGIGITTSTLSPQQMMNMRNRGQEIPTGGVTVSETLVIEFAAPTDNDATLQAVRQLLDTAGDLDASFAVGPNGRLVQPVIDDADELEGEAYAAAVADARERAERLAGLVDRKIASVHRVSVSQQTSQNNNASGVGTMNPAAFLQMVYSFDNGEVPNSTPLTSSLSTQTEKATVSITFNLE